MQSMNRLTLIGRLGEDPEKYTFQFGDIRTSFSLTTSESWNDDAGERRSARGAPCVRVQPRPGEIG